MSPTEILWYLGNTTLKLTATQFCIELDQSGLHRELSLNIFTRKPNFFVLNWLTFQIAMQFSLHNCITDIGCG